MQAPGNRNRKTAPLKSASGEGCKEVSTQPSNNLSLKFYLCVVFGILAVGGLGFGLGGFFFFDKKCSAKNLDNPSGKPQLGEPRTDRAPPKPTSL